jgi:hypothetical protein
MPKVTLVYTVFREVQLGQVDKAEIDELQQEDKKELEADGWGVEDPSWELDEDDPEVEGQPTKLEEP